MAEAESVPKQKRRRKKCPVTGCGRGFLGIGRKRSEICPRCEREADREWARWKAFRDAEEACFLQDLKDRSEMRQQEAEEMARRLAEGFSGRAS